eukprot:scaffold1371_cov55-Phaeocystis_antarctica.AAC.3
MRLRGSSRVRSSAARVRGAPAPGGQGIELRHYPPLERAKVPVEVACDGAVRGQLLQLDGLVLRGGRRREVHRQNLGRGREGSALGVGSGVAGVGVGRGDVHGDGYNGQLRRNAVHVPIVPAVCMQCTVHRPQRRACSAVPCAMHVPHRRHAPDRVCRVDLLGEDGQREAADALVAEVLVQQLSPRAQRQRRPAGHPHLGDRELRVAAQLQRAVDRDDAEVGQQPVEVAADRVVERNQQRANEQQKVEHSPCGQRARRPPRAARFD